MKKEGIAIIILSALLVVSNIGWITYYFQLQQAEETKGWCWNPDNGNNSWWGTESSKTTEAFRITGEEWRISWSFSGYAEGARCDITVYDAYADSEVKTLSLTYREEGYLNVTGRFYLTIRIYGSVDDWNIQVWEYR